MIDGGTGILSVNGSIMALMVPTLHTDRLKLEPISKSHSSGMFALWSDTKVFEYSGTIKDLNDNTIAMPVKTQAESDLIIDFWLKASVDGWGFRWAIILPEEDFFAGTIGFNSLRNPYEIAFRLRTILCGRGIMTEACAAAIQWSTENGATGIEAFISPENT